MKTKKILSIGASLVVLALFAGSQANAQFTGANVGTPTLSGSATTAGGVTTIVGGGNDIWGTSDNFYYYYKTVNSPVFDAIVQVRTLEGPDAWTKCELMVRVPDATGLPQGPDPFLAIMTTRTNGQNQIGPQWRVPRGGNADWTAMGKTIRPSYLPNPPTWLRIQREGSIFTLSYGTDGTTWTEYGKIDTFNGTPVGGDQASSFKTPLPDKVLVGIAVTAHNDGDLVGGVANISDLSVTETQVTPVLQVVSQVVADSAAPGCEATFSFTATNAAIANGQIGNYQWYKNGQPMTNAVGPKFTFLAADPQDSGAQIYCKAFAGASSSLNSATVALTLSTGTIVPNLVKREWWSRENRPNINAGNLGPAEKGMALSGFEIPSNVEDNYGDRISALFKPPTDGLYVFYISADDDADFYISTDASPANKRLVCQQEGWSNPRNWVTLGGGGGVYATGNKCSMTWFDGITSPYVSGIQLYANQSYYIEASHTEGGGGENLGVTFTLMGEVPPLDNDAPKFTSAMLSMYTYTATTLTITTNPVSLTVNEAQNAIFTVAATTDSEFTPLYQWQREGVNMPGETKSTLTLLADPVDNGKKYKCVVTVPASTLTQTSTEATLTVTPVPFINGLVKREIWWNNKTTRAAVEAGTAPAPDQTDYITKFDDENLGDNYVQRLSTWMVAPASGQYVFFVASDDDSDLFVSTNDKPAGLQKVCQEASWCGTREWLNDAERRSDQYSPDGGVTVPWGPPNYFGPLTQGQKSYIQMVQHEGTGGDNASANFSIVGSTTYPDPTANGQATRLAGNAIGVKAPAPTSLSITQQPANATVHVTGQATFKVGYSTDALYPPTFQWQKNGVNIPGATGPTYSMIASTNDNGAQFKCVVNLSFYPTPATSDAAVLTVVSATYTAGRLNEWRHAGAGSRANVAAGNFDQPSYKGTLPSFQSGVDVADGYVRRLSGIFTPPESGNYVFWVCGDDDIDLFISTDDQPSNKRLVAQETTWSAALAWTTSGGGSVLTQKRSDSWSPDGGATYPYPLAFLWLPARSTTSKPSKTKAAAATVVAPPSTSPVRPALMPPNRLTTMLRESWPPWSAPTMPLRRQNSP